MFLERPVARLSAALEATKPSSSAAAATRDLVAAETDPRPERARDAVDFDTFARFATSASVLMRLGYWSMVAEDWEFELSHPSTHVIANNDVCPRSPGSITDV